MDLQPVAELDWMETGPHLTFIGHQVQEQANQKRVTKLCPTTDLFWLFYLF